jgi:hypothetical protein
MGEAGAVKRYVLAWALTAVAATGAAVAVLGLLGGALTGTSGRVLSRDEVRAALSSITPAPTGTPGSTPARSMTAAPAPAATRVDRLIQTEGGTVIASCRGTEVTLRSWSPAQGYSVDGVEPGPARRATVEFEPGEGSGEEEDVEVTIGCTDGHPAALSG